MKLMGEDCTSEELAAFLDFDSVDELAESAAKNDGQVQTCSGFWSKPDHNIDNWVFVESIDWSE